jgi:lipopolysaccharide export LptBFGC system permease protein LptF
MTLPIYLIKKFFLSLVICTVVSYSFFFIFSLIGNLGEKLPFKSILYLSTLNSFQIFTYIPSHLFILSFCLFIISLKSKNELIIIKEYIELKKLILIIFPISVLFIFVEIRKNDISENIEIFKSNLIEPNHKDISKIFISTAENKKNYTIFSQNDNKNIIDQYLIFEIENNSIYRGEISTNLDLSKNNLVSNESTIYENNNFRHENIKKKNN